LGKAHKKNPQDDAIKTNLKVLYHRLQMDDTVWALDNELC